MDAIENKIREIVKNRLKTNESMSRYTTFRIGGKADYFVKLIKVEEIKNIIPILTENNIEYKVIGWGSNILVSEQGVSGAIFKLGGEFCQIKVSDKEIIAGAGVSVPLLIKSCVDNELEGIEFLAGIPGTLGGAVVMNAGTSEEGIGNLVEEVEVVSKDGSLKKLKKNDLAFNYRSSNISKEDIIIKTRLSLKKGSKNDILEKIKLKLQKRIKTQPLNFFNAGCIFKNPFKSNGLTAGELIEKSGLKGSKKGDAQVSMKHANFIVNLGKATAEDVLYLIDNVKKTVNEKFGVDLETEIKIWK